MKLYDLLSSIDTKPLNKIKRNIPQWNNCFLIIPMTNDDMFYLINMSTNKMIPYVPCVSDLLATDWMKF